MEDDCGQQPLTEEGRHFLSYKNKAKYPLRYKLILAIFSFLVGAIFGVLVYFVYAKYTKE